MNIDWQQFKNQIMTPKEQLQSEIKSLMAELLDFKTSYYRTIQVQKAVRSKQRQLKKLAHES